MLLAFMLGLAVGAVTAVTFGGSIVALTTALQSGRAKISTGNEGAALKVVGSTRDEPTEAQETVKAARISVLAKGVTDDTGCGTDKPAQAGLVDSGVPQLRKLAEYEAVCGGEAASRVSFFVGTPARQAQSSSEALWVAGVLKEISRYGLGAVVFMEPAGDGVVLDADKYRSGTYDLALDSFFTALKANGVTDAMMGTWVAFPEGNIPVWGDTDPSHFVANVTRTVQIQKRHFPGSHAAVLLETKSYPSADSWAGGTYSSLVPYVTGFPYGLIDSFGLQGFAWPPNAVGEAPLLDAKIFLNAEVAAEAADVLGVRDVWFNTGVFARSGRMGKTNPFSLDAAQRRKVLDDVITQAYILHRKGLNVSVHIFAENKFDTAEAIDWSYWRSGDYALAWVFKEFARNARAHNIGVWLYDSTD